MSTVQSVTEQWAKTVKFYEEIHPAHRQTPMTALVVAVAEAGIRNDVWPNHSHFDLHIFAEKPIEPFAVRPVSLSAIYWDEVDKFNLHFWGIQGIPYDTKWCELAEAEATLRYQFRQMREANLRAT